MELATSDHITLDSTIVHATDVIGTDIDEGHIILSIENGKYYGVTDVGERIWELCSQPITLRAICDRLMEEFEVERAVCEAEALKFATEMRANKIIRVQN